MIAQLSFLEEEPSTWTSADDWETPPFISQFMASLVLPSDQRILEPAAGTGQIAKCLPHRPSVVCVELNRMRWRIGLQYSHQGWLNKDFLSDSIPSPYDLIVTNPPFSLACEFLERSLELLDRSYPHARLLYLLPGDFFQGKGRNEAFSKLDAHIHHVYQIVGRVAYLKDGKPVSGRQVNDAIFDIRPGKRDGAVSFVRLSG